MTIRSIAAASIATILVSAVAFPALAAKDGAGKQGHDPQRRIEAMLKRLDTDKDGKISLAEIQADTTKRFAVADKDGNGEISRAEMQSVRKAMKDAHHAMREERREKGPKNEEARAEAREKIREARLAMVPGMRKGAFKKADIDGNGSLSRQEVDALVSENFNRRDKNSDGFIDAADFARKI